MTETLFTDAELEQCVRKPPERKDLYIVLAYNVVNRYWSIREGVYTSLEAAHLAAAKMTHIWQWHTIVRIKGTGDA